MPLIAAVPIAGILHSAVSGLLVDEALTCSEY
jgi:hypothetical protein